ncbi:MAG: Gfo/Idh/MocA family oxidoreductase [Armatimonadetes bacterium]|nr:Gfo/Idh/MocA family oxidoreductase [Planctomycetota bacterium]MBI2200674.1 Gfo/Idh/MocA family oxidoreductase [Armatimonadota bacterium]
MADSTIRVGVIGAGWFASRRHCPDIQKSPGARLTALCRRDPEKLRTMAEHFQAAHTFTDYRELVASGTVDGVVICSPHSLHYEHGRAALEAGLHVLMEKPLTLDAAQARELVELARRRGLALLVAQNPPFWNHCRYLREVIHRGEIGEIEAAEIHWVGNVEAVFGVVPLPASLPGVVPPTLFRHDPTLNGGGYFVDGGSHLVCELVWCTGLQVTEVSALMDHPEWDLCSAVTLRMSNGAMATITSTPTSKIFDKRIHSLYFGTAGTGFLRGMPFEVSIERPRAATVRLTEKELPPAPTPLANWLDCIRGRAQPELSGETAVHIVEVLAASYQAAKSGRKVTWAAGSP